MALQFACSRVLTEDEALAYCGDCLTEAVDLNPYLDAASDALWLLSHGVWTGRCTETVRPCHTSGCSAACGSCCTLDAIPLRGPNPVVNQIKIDGVVLNPSTYRIIDGNRLIRISADLTHPEPWPTCQPIWAPDSLEGTFSITVTYGLDADVFVKQAAAEIICMLLKTSNPQVNGLDPAVTSATIDGVTLSIDDVAEAAAEQGMNLPNVARFLGLYQGGGDGGAIVWSPEIDGWTLHVYDGS